MGVFVEDKKELLHNRWGNLLTKNGHIADLPVRTYSRMGYGITAFFLDKKDLVRLPYLLDAIPDNIKRVDPLRPHINTEKCWDTFSSQTPAGQLLVASYKNLVVSVTLGGDKKRYFQDLAYRYPVFLKEHRQPDTSPFQFNLWFANEGKTGEARDFRDLTSLSILVTGTKLQLAVYHQLLSLKKGQLITYSQLAERAGYPGAVRAVATAVANNPIGVVIPCHLVVPKGFQKTGYGIYNRSKLQGETIKRALIEREGVFR